MTAPFLPPMMAPRIAPPTAAPPILRRSRRPAIRLRGGSLRCGSARSVPSASTSVWNRTPRRARSFTLPPRSTSVTEPTTRVPAGIAVRPSTETIARDARLDTILDPRALARHRGLHLKAHHRRGGNHELYELGPGGGGGGSGRGASDRRCGRDGLWRRDRRGLRPARCGTRRLDRRFAGGRRGGIRWRGARAGSGFGVRGRLSAGTGSGSGAARRGLSTAGASGPVPVRAWVPAGSRPPRYPCTAGLAVLSGLAGASECAGAGGGLF